MEYIYRRFIPIGTEKEMDRFHSLVEEKKLSRNDMLTILFANALPALVEKKHLSEDDLSIVLRAIKLNPGIFG